MMLFSNNYLNWIILANIILNCMAGLFPPQYRPVSTTIDESRQLKDGLLVSRGEDVLIEDASWMVVVTLDTPKLPEGLENHLQRVDTALRKLRSNLSLSEYRSWQTRLTQVKLRLTPDYLYNNRHHLKTRKKRGLFNFIGLLSHHLFGTATDSEIQEVREIMSKMDKNNQAVNHVINELATVINQSQLYIQENRNMINQLTTETRTLIKYVQNFSELGHVVNTNLQRHYAERLVEDVELLATAYTSIVEHYHRQRTAMEMGVLTEDLLSPSVLKDIVVQARARQQDMISTWEWYYQNVRVQPLWGSDDVVVFQIEMPLVRPVKYVHYLLDSFPVPQEGSTTTTLKVEQHVAFDEVTRGLFVPRNCRGHDPMVCQPAPVRVGPAMSCERGIITNQGTERQKCIIRVEKTTQVDQLWFVEENRIVLSTWGDNLKKHCQEYPEQKRALEKGVYLFNISENCIYLGSTWQVEHSPRFSHNVYIERHPLPAISPVELPVLFNGTGLSKDLMSDLHELGAIKHFTIAKLQELSIPTIPVYKKGWFWAIFCAVLVSGLLIVSIIYVCKYYVYPEEKEIEITESPKDSEPLEELIESNQNQSSLNKHSLTTTSVSEKEQGLKFQFKDSLTGKRFGVIS